MLFGINLGIIPQSGMEVFSIFFFASYIFWYYFGSKLGKLIHGYRPYQQGYYLIFRPVKKFMEDREQREKKAKENAE
jgi:hypothetical protein